MKVLLLLLSISAVSFATVHYEERFNSDEVFKTWTQSNFKSDLGKFIISSGTTDANKDEDKGLKTSEDAKFYGLATKFPAFTNKDKDLIIQFTVKHEQGIDCGGGYVKVFGSDVDPASFHGESPYHIMFGPDICGMSTKRVHVIFGYKGKNHLVKKDIQCKDDKLTHSYRLVVKPSNEYEVYIDGSKVESGSLFEDFEMLLPKTIDDDSIKKPEDWVDEKMMDDPEDKKPEDWDKPKTIPDSSVTKPEDWDDEMDGEWEPPMINNPDYKGDWKPKQIENPAYKGAWKQPQKPNPDYVDDKELYMFKDISGIGFDLWQVKSGTIFDNLLITDDFNEAVKQTDEIWKPRHAAEEEYQKEQDKKDEEMAKKMAEKKSDETDDSEKTEDKPEEEGEEKKTEAHDEL